MRSHFLPSAPAAAPAPAPAPPPAPPPAPAPEAKPRGRRLSAGAPAARSEVLAADCASPPRSAGAAVARPAWTHARVSRLRVLLLLLHSIIFGLGDALHRTHSPLLALKHAADMHQTSRRSTPEGHNHLKVPCSI